MSILCAVAGLLQLIILVALTGILVAVAAASRLMEIIISYLYPLNLFLVNQSGRLIICGVNLAAAQTWHLCKKMCQKRPAEFNLRAPEISYTNGIVTLGTVDDSHTVAPTQNDEEPQTPAPTLENDEQPQTTAPALENGEDAEAEAPNLEEEVTA